MCVQTSLGTQGWRQTLSRQVREGFPGDLTVLMGLKNDNLQLSEGEDRRGGDQVSSRWDMLGLEKKESSPGRRALRGHHG